MSSEVPKINMLIRKLSSMATLHSWTGSCQDLLLRDYWSISRLLLPVTVLPGGNMLRPVLWSSVSREHLREMLFSQQCEYYVF